MSKLRFDKLKMQLQRAQERALDEMASAAEKHFKDDAFNSKSFNGTGWSARKDNKAHPLLQKTMLMRNSIRTLLKRRESRIVGTYVPYAVYHNTGTPKMARRQFIGESSALNRKFSQILNRMFRGIR